MNSATDNIVEVRALTKHFVRKPALPWGEPGVVRAVEGVSLSIPRGKTVGLVGESGSGKTTFGRALLRLVEPTSGEVVFRGADGVATDVISADTATMRRLRRSMQIVFQDPYHSLNPARTAGEIVAEGLFIHGTGSRADALDAAHAMLRRVGLPDESMRRPPRAFSGGQRQRIALARALVLRPEFIVCDEITSALDVSTQARMLALLAELRVEMNLSLLFISHDLHTVAKVSDHVHVMHRGRIVEEGAPARIFSEPAEDYTRALVAALPASSPVRRRFRRTRIARES
ncbi:MAG TPA: ATP-binding cassette domain-containing protein [Opitutaceae bacterium]|nr:ATP-binding cassette domain-containing protein [Opitutaceae bacterium]